MADETASETVATLSDPVVDLNARIDALREAGVGQFDPVRLHYLDVLSRRAATHRGTARRLLDTKLTHALADLTDRFTMAQCNARDTIAGTAQHFPQAADALHRLLAAHDLRGVQRLAYTVTASQAHASLRALVHQLEESASVSSTTPTQGSTERRSELKTLRNFRNTWSKLSTDKQVAKALAQAPRNAGPINSHMLVLRSLALMRDISPDYLNRFMSYADTLLSLEQDDSMRPPAAKKPKVAKVARVLKK